MSIIGLIPARAGSKGLPGKNFRNLGFKEHRPLWSVQAFAGASLDRTVVSTDAPELVRDWPGHPMVTILERDIASSNDTAPISAVVKHAAQALELKPDDAVLLLSPTFPRRRRSDVRAVIEQYRATNRSLIGFTSVEQHPYLMYRVQDGYMTPFANPNVDNFYRRQDYPTVHRLTTFVCLVRVADIERINSQCFVAGAVGSMPVWVDPEKTFDIDTAEDLEEARRWLETNGLP